MHMKEFIFILRAKKVPTTHPINKNEVHDPIHLTV